MFFYTSGKLINYIINIYYIYVFLFDKNQYNLIKLLYDDWVQRFTLEIMHIFF